jgi:hypothetical protein
MVFAWFTPKPPRPWVDAHCRCSGCGGTPTPDAPRRARPGRIADQCNHQHGGQQAEPAEKQQRRAGAPAVQRGQRSRGQRDAERLRALPDTHRQAALVLGEPAQDESAARGEHRATGAAGGGQAQAEPHGTVHRGADQQHATGKPEPGRQHHALPEAVSSAAPGDEGQQQSCRGTGDQSAGEFQREALLPERRDQVGQPVLERAPGRHRDEPDQQDQPPPAGRRTARDMLARSRPVPAVPRAGRGCI